MLEIFFVIWLSGKIANIAKEKGHKPGGYRAGAIALWFVGEILFGVVGFLLFGNTEMACLFYLFALVGAAGGLGIIYLIVQNLPDLSYASQMSSNIIQPAPMGKMQATSTYPPQDGGKPAVISPMAITPAQPEARLTPVSYQAPPPIPSQYKIMMEPVLDQAPPPPTQAEFKPTSPPVPTYRSYDQKNTPPEEITPAILPLQPASISRNASLIVESGKLAGRTFFIQDNTTLGNKDSSDMLLPNETTPNQEIRFRLVQGNWFVQSVGSTAGVAVNHQTVQASRLTNGDIIHFGEMVFKFQPI